MHRNALICPPRPLIGGALARHPHPPPAPPGGLYKSRHLPRNIISFQTPGGATTVCSDGTRFSNIWIESATMNIFSVLLRLGLVVTVVGTGVRDSDAATMEETMKLLSIKQNALSARHILEMTAVKKDIELLR